MTFPRAVFLFAIVMLMVGLMASRIMLQNLFGPSAQPLATAAVAEQPNASTTPTTSRTAPHRAKPAAMSTAVALHRHKARFAHPGRPRHARRHLHAVIRRAVATPTPVPVPTRPSGIFALTRYWVDENVARHGNTIALGYTVDNETGRTMRVMLGASVKPVRAASWVSQSLSDPGHDVVAVVPPGISTHTRYFTLPAGLRPGSYDVAWGLRDAVTGLRAGLVAAPAALQVVR